MRDHLEVALISTFKPTIASWESTFPLDSFLRNSFKSQGRYSKTMTIFLAAKITSKIFTILGWFSPFRIDISLIVVLESPSLSGSYLSFFIATIYCSFWSKAL